VLCKKGGHPDAGAISINSPGGEGGGLHETRDATEVKDMPRGVKFRVGREGHRRLKESALEPEFGMHRSERDGEGSV